MHILITRDGPSRIYLHTDFEISNSDRVREIDPSWTDQEKTKVLGPTESEQTFDFFEQLDVAGILTTSISRYQFRVTRYKAFDFEKIIKAVIKLMIEAFEIDVAELEIGEGVGWGDDTFNIVTTEFFP